MAKAYITHNFSQAERKAYASSLATLATPDIAQAAVWLRQGYDVVLTTNVFDGHEVIVQEKEETNE